MEVVVPLGEVEIAFGPFDLAALEIHGVAAWVFLLRVEVAAEVGIDHKAVRLNSAEEEIAAVGGDPEALVNRNPAVALEINLSPVVEVAGAGVRHQAALPSGGDAFVAAHRDEQKRHLAAVAVAVFKDIFRNIPYCGIVPCGCPREGLVDPAVDRLGLEVRVVYACGDGVGGRLDPVGEDDVLASLGGIFVIVRSLLVVGEYFGRVDRMPLAAGDIFKDFIKDGGFVPCGLRFEIDAGVRVGRA